MLSAVRQQEVLTTFCEACASLEESFYDSSFAASPEQQSDHFATITSRHPKTHACVPIKHQ
jgi:hypothetical protein